VAANQVKGPLGKVLLKNEQKFTNVTYYSVAFVLWRVPIRNVLSEANTIPFVTITENDIHSLALLIL
jgi:hypothetical protein